MKKAQKVANVSFNPEVLKFYQEGGGVRLDTEKYSEVYREMAEILKSERAVIEIWKRFSGLTITFPQRLYSREYVLSYTEENIGKLKPKEIAREMNLSERRVRQIIRELKQNNKKTEDEI